MRVDVKPLSVNEAWKGRRYKTEKYKRYEFYLLATLPNLELPEPPFRVYYEFGLSNVCADIDNPVKPFQDVLQKRYKFNDSQIHQIEIKRETVPKGKEYIFFKIFSIDS